MTALVVIETVKCVRLFFFLSLQASNELDVSVFLVTLSDANCVPGYPAGSPPWLSALSTDHLHWFKEQGFKEDLLFNAPTSEQAGLN